MVTLKRGIYNLIYSKTPNANTELVKKETVSKKPNQIKRQIKNGVVRSKRLCITSTEKSKRRTKVYRKWNKDKKGMQDEDEQDYYPSNFFIKIMVLISR